MSMSDPIADLLTRIRNALRAGHATVDVPASNLKVGICNVLKQEGYITDYRVMEADNKRTIRIELKYLQDRRPVIQHLQRVSRPSLRIYVAHDRIEPVQSGLGISILTTSKGVMSGKQARLERVGGEVLCEVW